MLIAAGCAAASASSSIPLSLRAALGLCGVQDTMAAEQRLRVDGSLIPSRFDG
jgi:hypothetical protein